MHVVNSHKFSLTISNTEEVHNRNSMSVKAFNQNVHVLYGRNNTISTFYMGSKASILILASLYRGLCQDYSCEVEA